MKTSKPKYIFNKDGSHDLIYKKKDFDRYFMFGCLIEYSLNGKPNSKVRVRVRGPVGDLQAVVVRR